jgi:hypothetical protein
MLSTPEIQEVRENVKKTKMRIAEVINANHTDTLEFFNSFIGDWIIIKQSGKKATRNTANGPLPTKTPARE